LKLTPRAKLLLLMGLFALPIAASVLAYNFLHLEPTANYGELITPPVQVTAQRFQRPDGTPFTFADVAGRWALVTSDSGACAAACQDKLVMLRQVRLALGRNAGRVERVFIVDDARIPAASSIEPFPGMLVAVAPGGARLPSGPARDRAHIYLVDPNGNVMMRWPWPSENRRVFKDLERLLKASQIG